MESGENLLNNDLQIDSTAAMQLKETAMWARFLGVVGFIMSALLAIIAIFAGAILGKMMSVNPYAQASSLGSAMGGVITVFYLIIAAVAFLLSLLTYRFGVRTKAALATNDQSTLNAGLGSLKVLFRVYGIFTIIYILLIVLIFVSGIIGAAFSGGI